MFNVLGTVLNSVGGLATSYIEGKTAVKKAEATKNLKIATGEIDWDLEAMKATQSSWKDEWLTILLSFPFILSFCGDWGREMAAAGFSALEQAPSWYSYSLGVVIAASFGIRSATKFFGGKK